MFQIIFWWSNSQNELQIKSQRFSVEEAVRKILFEMSSSEEELEL